MTSVQKHNDGETISNKDEKNGSLVKSSSRAHDSLGADDMEDDEVIVLEADNPD